MREKITRLTTMFFLMLTICVSARADNYVSVNVDFDVPVGGSAWTKINPTAGDNRGIYDLDGSTYTETSAGEFMMPSTMPNENGRGAASFPVGFSAGGITKPGSYSGSFEVKYVDKSDFRSTKYLYLTVDYNVYIRASTATLSIKPQSPSASDFFSTNAGLHRYHSLSAFQLAALTSHGSSLLQTSASISSTQLFAVIDLAAESSIGNIAGRSNKHTSGDKTSEVWGSYSILRLLSGERTEAVHQIEPV